MNAIPEWQYPLYKESDKEAYKLLEKLGNSGEYPALAVDEEADRIHYFKLLLTSQRMRKYREFRDIVLKEFEKEKVLLPTIISQGQKLDTSDNSWAIFTQDKRLLEVVDKIGSSSISVAGSMRDLAEFTVRYWLSQLLFDWRGPLMAICEEILKKNVADLRSLNDLLKRWDYTGIF